MSVVDFSSIPTYPVDTTLPSDYGEVSPSGAVPNPVSARYDSRWGFFLFEQSIDFTYNPAGTYKSGATFTITGTYTANATPPSGVRPPNGWTDEQKFNRLKDHYNGLVAVFDSVYNQDPPTDLSQYGTASDPRVIALPDPLRNAASGVVYGRPVSLQVEESRWPEYIKYSAVLSEVSVIGGKATIEGKVLDDARVTITAKKPRLRVQKFPFANSEEVYFGGFDPRVYQISGILPSIPEQANLSSPEIRELIQDLMDGRATIGRQIGATLTPLWSDLFVDQSSVNIQKTPDGKGTAVDVTAQP
jgi:hypothetical protein